MKGLLEIVLTKMYGIPEIKVSKEYKEFWWNPDDENKKIILYGIANWDDEILSSRNAYKYIYGNHYGGFILGSSLKVAWLAPKDIYGLFHLEELHQQPEIQLALSMNPDIHFFMDAANEYFYGFYNNSLFVYNADYQEIELLGDTTLALETVFREWEEAES